MSARLGCNLKYSPGPALPVAGQKLGKPMQRRGIRPGLGGYDFLFREPRIDGADDPGFGQRSLWYPSLR